VTTLNNGTNSQISTFFQSLDFHRQNVLCHSIASITENSWENQKQLRMKGLR
jgi:hypothetical protein